MKMARINTITGERSIRPPKDGKIFRNGSKTGSVIVKSNLVNGFLGLGSNQDKIARRIIIYIYICKSLITMILTYNLFSN